MKARAAATCLLLCLTSTSAWVAPAADASSAGETCRGQAATIVGGKSIAPLVGTDGPDVIVTNGSPLVKAKGGDDLICATASRPDPPNSVSSVPSIDAGTGDDLVDTTAQVAGVHGVTFLGPGDDQFFGGAASELVSASDAGHDQISTGAGDDVVFSGSPHGLDQDAVDLGEGDDWFNLDTAIGTDTTVAGGEGSDLLSGPGARTGAWVFDNQLGQASRDGVVQLRWSGMERFAPDNITRPERLRGSVAFVGTPADEFFALSTTRLAGVVAGPGDDTVVVANARAIPGAVIDGDTGLDRVIAYAQWAPYPKKLRISLAKQVLRYAFRHRDPLVEPLTGFEEVEAAAPVLHVSGDAGDNRIWWSGCHVEAVGGAGNDTIRFRNRGYLCNDQRVRVYGNAGFDHLTGSLRTDHLIGGPDYDWVDGKARTDYCQAEWVRNCEVIVP